MPQPDLQPSSQPMPNRADGYSADGDPGARERAERARRERDASTVQVPHPEQQSFGTSFLGEEHGQDAWQRWREIQANFVDEPRRAVGEAHHLVSELIDDMVRRFETEREELEQRWSSGENVSTEDLRRCLQRYRDFFGRLSAQGVS